MPKLIIKKGDTVLKKLAVPDDILAFTVGSEQGNDIIINENSISFFHLQFEKQVDEYYVRDLQSQSGTFVNGARISSRTILNDHDDIGVGTHTIIFIHGHNKNGGTKTHTPQQKRATEPEYSQETAEPALPEEPEYQMDEPTPIESNSTEPDFKLRSESVPGLNRLNDWLNTDESLLDDETSDNGSYTSETASVPVEEMTTAEQSSPANSEQENVTPEDSIENSNGGAPSDMIELPDFLLDPDPIPESISEPVAKTATGRSTTTHSQELTSQTAERSNFYLLGIYGYYLGRKFRIKSGMTRIGRDRKLNDIVISKNSSGELDKSVSRRQASIRSKDNHYYLLDKRSQSRTALNNRKIATDEHLELVVGDELEIESDRKNHIFRMVDNGDWDFSFPHKSGPWHVRNRSLLLHASSIAFIVLALIFFISAFRSSYIINSTPGDLKVETSLWHNSEVKAATNGQLQPSIFPATSDFNGDGTTDIIFTNGDGKLICYNGLDKSILWSGHDFQARADLPVTIADLHNDGHDDVIVISNDLRVRAIDGKWGLEIWKSPILAGPLVGPPVVLDLNGDALNDAVIASKAGLIYIGISGPKNARWQQVKLPDTPTAVLSAAVLQPGARPKIVIGTENGLLLIVNSANNSISQEINISEELSKATGQYIRSSRIVGPSGIADLDDDGIKDLVVMTESGHVLALNGNDLTRLWYDIEKSPEESSRRFTSVILGNFDDDDMADVSVITNNGNIKVLKGTGQGGDRKLMLWENTVSDVLPLANIAAIADWNKNGTDDIVVNNRRGKLLIFEGSDGRIIMNKTLSEQPIKSPPLIADFDNDNDLDLLTVQSDAKFHIWQTNRTIPAGNIVWAQTFGTSNHTLYSTFAEPGGGNHYLIMLLSVFTVAGVLAVQFLFRRSRARLSDYT